MKTKRLLIVLTILSLGYVGCQKEKLPADTEHGTGLDSQLPDIYYLVPPAAIPLAGGPFPDSYELEMPPSGNQGNQGSCVGWAVGYALKGYQRKKEFNLNYSTGNGVNYGTVCSPAYIYNQIKQTNDCQAGSLITNALQLLVNKGVCPWNDMPYNSTDCSTQPTASQTSQASSNKASIWGTVPITVDAIKNAIYNDLPVVVGLHIDRNFFYPSSANSYLWNSLDYSLSGYHAVVINGWDDNKQALKIFNSWGTSWADNGYIWMSYNILTQACFQAYTATNDSGGIVNGPVISVPAQLNFGNVQINTSSTQNIWVQNTGTSALTVNSITGTAPGTFGISAPATPFIIAPGGNQSISITFSPAAVNTYNASLVINSNALSGSATVSMAGVGTSGGSGGACSSGGWGYIQVNNNYNEEVRVYLDNASSPDMVLNAGQTGVKYAVSTGHHTYRIFGNSTFADLDKAEVCINQPCDTALISKNAPVLNTNPDNCSGNEWGIIKVTNTYGEEVRVYIDNSATNQMLVPAGQTRYLFNIITGTHDYRVFGNSSFSDIDKAQVNINQSCATALISKNMPLPTGTATAYNCQSNTIGVIQVKNNYGEDVRVYLDHSSTNNMLIPTGQTRYYYETQGTHAYRVFGNSTFSDIDQAEIHISSACDTVSIGTLLNTGGSYPTGCTNGWGVFKVVNNRNESLRVYIDNSSSYSMYIPIGAARYIYQQNTGIQHPYRVFGNSTFSDIQVSQFFINNSCDTETITVN